MVFIHQLIHDYIHTTKSKVDPTEKKKNGYKLPRNNEEYKMYDKIVVEPWDKVFDEITKDHEEIRIEAYPVDADLHRQLKLPSKTWEIHFFSSEEPEQDTNKSPIKLLGTGNAVKKMTAVMQVAKQILQQPFANHLLIAAYKNEPSRVKLYDRLTRPHQKKKWEFDDVVYWLI